jgi:predicted lactoylglutathione lyase
MWTGSLESKNVLLKVRFAARNNSFITPQQSDTRRQTDDLKSLSLGASNQVTKRLRLGDEQDKKINTRNVESKVT